MDRDEAYYEAHAQDVDLKTIASSDDENMEILHMLSYDECNRDNSVNVADDENTTPRSFSEALGRLHPKGSI